MELEKSLDIIEKISLNKSANNLPSFMGDNPFDEQTISDTRNKFFIKLGNLAGSNMKRKMIESQIDLSQKKLSNCSKNNLDDSGIRLRKDIESQTNNFGSEIRESILSRENVRSTDNLYIRENFSVFKDQFLSKKAQPTKISTDAQRISHKNQAPSKIDIKKIIKIDGKSSRQEGEKSKEILLDIQPHIKNNRILRQNVSEDRKKKQEIGKVGIVSEKFFGMHNTI